MGRMTSHLKINLKNDGVKVNGVGMTSNLKINLKNDGVKVNGVGMTSHT